MSPVPASLTTVALAILALAVALGMVRRLVGVARVPAAERPPTWRLALRVLLPVVCAALLYRTLFPPAPSTGTYTLVVATAGAGAVPDAIGTSTERRIALPEAGALIGAERVPDLATALRRHPDARALRIVGAGLTARDRDIAPGLPVTFVPSPLPRGLVELTAPGRVAAGSPFTVLGRAEGLRSGTAELLDPAGRVQERQALDEAGLFRLTAGSRAAGATIWRVRLRDSARRVVDAAEVPVVVRNAPPTRLLVLAGATNAETKFLRRWALDAGLDLHTRIELGGGLQLGDAPVAYTVDNLQRFDAIVVDPRRWQALGAGRRQSILEAVRGGLGLLVRTDGSTGPQLQRMLRALGLRVGAAASPATFVLARQTDPTTSATSSPAAVDLPLLARAPIDVAGNDAVTVLRDANGTAMAGFVPRGRGRIGWWLAAESYPLVLAGRADLHAALWSRAVGAVVRPDAAAPAPRISEPAWRGERVALCGLSGAARVTGPEGGSTPLHLDPDTPGCAGYWPRSSGWHWLHDGDAVQPFHVRDPAKAPALRAADLREATQRWAMTARLPARMPSATAPPSRPGAATLPANRWPWFFAWLLASALLWWLERPRAAAHPRDRAAA